MAQDVTLAEAKTMTFNEALGFTVNQYLFAHHLTRERLGKMLGVSGGVASKKVRGLVGWSAQDVAVVADRFGVSIDDLMPRKIEEAPAAGGGEGENNSNQTTRPQQFSNPVGRGLGWSAPKRAPVDG